MKEIIKNLKKELTLSVKRNTAQGLLFSGGVDSSILAVLNPTIKAITVSLESSGEDIKYARRVTNLLNMKHYHVIVEIEEAIAAIPEVIKILKTFDPAIPNDLTVFFGLRYANEVGIKEIITGDGADEFFAGYNFMKSIKDLDKYIKRISISPVFNSTKLGSFFNIKIKQPFLKKGLTCLARDIPAELKIKKEKGDIHGKWILRKAFEDRLPKDIIWQDKRPLELGSGMSRLRQIISSRISNKEFEEKMKMYSVNFMNKEHLYYYEIYRKKVGEIPKPSKGEKICMGCKTGMKPNAFHCKLCGNVLNWRS